MITVPLLIIIPSYAYSVFYYLMPDLGQLNVIYQYILQTGYDARVLHVYIDI